MSQDAPTEASRPSTYDVFISYRTSTVPDGQVGVALQRILESQAIPRRSRAYVVKPQCLGCRLKVFRDRTDLTTSSDLESAIKDKLANSRWLIVVCSPNTPRSRYCNEEVRHFIALHGADSVLLVHVDGELAPSLPLPLAEHLSSPRPEDIVVVDVRAGSSPARIRRLRATRFRLLAPILGWSSAEALARWQKRLVAIRLSVLVGPMVLALSGLLLFTHQQAKQTEIRSQALKILDELSGEGQIPREAEYVALERLRATPVEVRLSAIDSVLQSEELSERLEFRLKYLAHAVIGLDASTRLARPIGKTGA